MYVSKLSLTNFRSYPQLDLTLKPGVTTFVGNNGAGKTNVAESLIFLSFLSSHRTPTNQPLISLGADQAVIRAEIVRGDRNLQIDLEINGNKANRAKINQIIDLYTSRKIANYATAENVVIRLADKRSVKSGKADKMFEQVMGKYTGAVPVTEEE